MKYYFIITAVFLLFLPAFVFAASDTFYTYQIGWERYETSEPSKIWNSYIEANGLVVGNYSGTYKGFGGFAFENLDIPAGAIIENATITGLIKECENTPAAFKIYGVDTDNFTEFSLTNLPDEITLTESFLSNSGNCATSSEFEMSGLNIIINEIINRSGWSSGNNLALVFWPDNINGFIRFGDSWTLFISWSMPLILSECTPPANDDISIITGCKNIYASTTSSSTITGIETFSYYSPAILLLYIFIIVLLIAIVIAVWILRHDLH